MGYVIWDDGYIPPNRHEMGAWWRFLGMGGIQAHIPMMEWHTGQAKEMITIDELKVLQTFTRQTGIYDTKINRHFEMLKQYEEEVHPTGIVLPRDRPTVTTGFDPALRSPNDYIMWFFGDWTPRPKERGYAKLTGIRAW